VTCTEFLDYDGPHTTTVELLFRVPFGCLLRAAEGERRGCHLNSNERERSTEDKCSSDCSQNCNYSCLQQQLSVRLHCTSDRISWYPVRSCGRRLQWSRPVEAAFAAHLGRTLADPYIWRSVPRDGVNGRGTDGTRSVLTPSSSRVRVSSPQLCARRRFPDRGSALGTAAGRARPRALPPPAAGSLTRGVTARRRDCLQRERLSPLLCARSRFPDRGSALGTAAGRARPRALPPPAAGSPTLGVTARRRG